MQCVYQRILIVLQVRVIFVVCYYDVEFFLCNTFTNVMILFTASESDFCKVVEELGPYELWHLFNNLGISQRDIEHAEKGADTAVTRLKARAVLRWWKQTNGQNATREALFAAKRKLHQSTGTYFLSLFLCFNYDERIYIPQWMTLYRPDDIYSAEQIQNVWWSDCL